jgi:PAS domain S-box-containing protein
MLSGDFSSARGYQQLLAASLNHADELARAEDERDHECTTANTTAAPQQKDMNTNRKHSLKDPQPRTAHFKRILQTLIEPAPDFRDVALRHKSRLLAIFLLIMTAIFMLVDTQRSLTIPEYHVPWYGYLFLGTAYILNRTQHYVLAAALTLSMFPLVVFATPWSDAPSTINTLNYLVLGILLASIFFSVRGLAIIAAVNIVGMLLLAILVPVAIPTFTRIVTPLAVNTIGAALALVFMRHRDQVERGRQAELRTSEERLRLALDAARMGTWDWDVLADIVTSSEQVAKLFGLPPGAGPDTHAAYLGLIHPFDRAAVADAIAATLAGTGGDYSVAHRILCPDGNLRWLEVHGRAYRDETGRSVRMTGTVMDITARKQAEAERERAEAALVASERRFRALMTTARMLWPCSIGTELYSMPARPQREFWGMTWMPTLAKTHLRSSIPTTCNPQPSSLPNWCAGLRAGSPLNSVLCIWMGPGAGSKRLR